MTTRQLADILAKCGVVQAGAVDDPEGYDNCETMGAISEAAALVTAQEIKMLKIATDSLAIAIKNRDAAREALATHLRPAPTMPQGEPEGAWCADCGEPMRLNVPRLGADGGYVHAGTGLALCPMNKSAPAESHCHAPDEPARHTVNKSVDTQ